MQLTTSTVARGVTLVAAVGLLTSCANGASYATRISYLKATAQEGVQTHRLLVSQGAPISGQRCGAAYKGLQDQNPPDDTGTGAPSQPWLDQIQAFFVQSCVTGLPKAVLGQRVSPYPSTSPISSPAPVSSESSTTKGSTP